MIVSWFITTLVISVLTILINYISYPSSSVGTNEIYIAPSFLSEILVVIGINLFFWLPAIIYLHKNKRVSLGSSVISSVAAFFVGSVGIIGVVILFFYAVEQAQQINSSGELTRYTDWTIGHVHYLPGIFSNVVLWGIGGIIFWKLYCKFGTNK